MQMENISTPKLRVELEPPQSRFSSLKVDAGYSWYRLDSAKDRWNAGGNLRDANGESGKNVGEEFGMRVRFPVNKYVGANIGYAHFWAGDVAKTTTQHIAPDRKDTSNSLYVEITASAF